MVLAVEAGVPLPDVQQIVGHTTTEMTMQYFNPEKKHTAERVQRKMSGTVLGRVGGRWHEQIDSVSPSNITRSSLSVDDFLALLTNEQRKELASKLLANVG